MIELYLDSKIESQYKNLNLVDFLTKYFEDENPATYKDGDLQCRQGKRRSLSDLKDLFNTYNPDKPIYELDIAAALGKINTKGNCIHIRYCPDVQKVVLFLRANRHALYVNTTIDSIKVHYSMNCSKITGIDNIKIIDILEILGIDYKKVEFIY